MRNKKDRKIVYIDMDGVLVDFEKGPEHISKDFLKELEEKYQRRSYIPGYFKNLPIMKGAKKAVDFLTEHFDVYVLTSPSVNNPSSFTDKKLWIDAHFPVLSRKIILTYNKGLYRGDYLIDDRKIRGVENFQGEHIWFGTEKFPNWKSVIKYLKDKENIL